MQKVLIATTNPGKLKEIKEYLSDLLIEFVSLKDVGITDEVVEDGKTYEENSQKKALHYAKLSGLPAISDDGGVEIAALNNEPGVNSKYWAGPLGRDEDLIEKMKKVITEIPDDNRSAKFYAVLTLALPTGEFWSQRANVDLEVAKEPLMKEIKGFPFRSFLIVPQINKYYHEEQLSEEEKKAYNHRYKALMQLKPIIKEKLDL